MFFKDDIKKLKDNVRKMTKSHKCISDLINSECESPEPLDVEKIAVKKKPVIDSIESKDVALEQRKLNWGLKHGVIN